MSTTTAVLSYFLLLASAGCYDPFTSLMLSQRGLSKTQVGAVLSLRPIFSLVSAPLWSAIADHGGRHRLVGTVCIVTSAAFALLLAMFCSSGVTSVLLLALPVCSLAFTRAPLSPLLDSAALRALGTGGRSRYGRLRMWGGISFGLFGTFIGVVARPFFGSVISPIAFAVFILLALPPFLALLSAQSPPPITTEAAAAATSTKPSFWEAVKELAKIPGVAAFGVTLLAQGFAGSVISNFYPLIVAADPTASKAVLGYSVGISVVAELPVFYFSEQLLAKFGPKALIAIAQLSTVVRLLGYTVLTGNALLLPQLLHGLTFAAMWTSTVVYTSEIAPPAVAATAQSLVSAIFVSLSGIICNFTSGLVFDHFGPASVFRLAATFCAASLGIFWLFTPSTRGSKNKGKKE